MITLHAGEDVEELTPTGMWESRLVQPVGKAVWLFASKTKHETTIQSINYTPGHLSQRNQNFSPLKNLSTNVYMSSVLKLASYL